MSNSFPVHRFAGSLDRFRGRRSAAVIAMCAVVPVGALAMHLRDTVPVSVVVPWSAPAPREGVVLPRFTVPADQPVHAVPAAGPAPSPGGDLWHMLTDDTARTARGQMRIANDLRQAIRAQIEQLLAPVVRGH